MDLDRKCEEVMKSRGWSQRQLADAIGVTDKNLISMRRGRRPMPAHALIRLERLRGTDDHSIIEQILKTAACVALAFVVLLMPSEGNAAIESRAYGTAAFHNADYRVLRRLRAWIVRAWSRFKNARSPRHCGAAPAWA